MEKTFEQYHEEQEALRKEKQYIIDYDAAVAERERLKEEETAAFLSELDKQAEISRRKQDALNHDLNCIFEKKDRALQQELEQQIEAESQKVREELTKKSVDQYGYRTWNDSATKIGKALAELLK